MLSSHTAITIINASTDVFYDTEAFENRLCVKYLLRTIMQLYCFIVHLDNVTCMYIKILSNTADALVCNLKKGSHQRTKILYSPVPFHAQLAVQDDAKGFTLEETHNLDNKSPALHDNTTLVLSDLADPSLCVPPETALLSAPLPSIPPPTMPISSSPMLYMPLLKKHKLSAVTITKDIACGINKLITNVEQRTKLLNKSYCAQ